MGKWSKHKRPQLNDLGKYGVRTVHQRDPKAQLVLSITSTTPAAADASSAHRGPLAPGGALPAVAAEHASLGQKLVLEDTALGQDDDSEPSSLNRKGDSEHVSLRGGRGSERDSEHDPEHDSKHGVDAEKLLDVGVSAAALDAAASGAQASFDRASAAGAGGRTLSDDAEQAGRLREGELSGGPQIGSGTDPSRPPSGPLAPEPSEGPTAPRRPVPPGTSAGAAAGAPAAGASLDRLGEPDVLVVPRFLQNHNNDAAAGAQTDRDAAPGDAAGWEGEPGERGPGQAASLRGDDTPWGGHVAGGTSSYCEAPPAGQAVLLALAQVVRASTPADALQQWEMAPYVEAVLGQARTLPVLRSAAMLLRARHERTRARTRFRAIETLQQLGDAGARPQPPAALRMRYVFSVSFPMRSALRKELGEELIANGLVGEAMRLFEELEQWDALITCYRLLGKTAQAEKLIRQRLEVAPKDARLWCALGDVTGDDSHLRTAWDVSGGRSVRAQRALARSAQRRKSYAEAGAHWETALAVNPLHPAGWFALGFCCLKTDDLPRAVQAFTRCVQEDPGNAEAWNNVSAVHLREGRWREAFHALDQAVRLRRGSWQTWSNYATAAARSGHALQAARAVQEVLALTQGARLEADILQSLVDQLSADGQALKDETQQRERKQLESSLGDVLKAAAQTAAADSVLWGIFAQFYRLQGEPESARECLVKRVRGLQASGWQRDADKFRVYAEASADMAVAYIESGLPRELSSARMHLRGVVKQAEERFGDTQAFARLQELLGRAEAGLAG